VGPIRLDVAIPINPDNGDPNYALYFGIGQSF
jgi:translocation and assembly module TamA